MDQATRDSLIDLLGRAMSEISEEAYCAGWAGGTEYFVPELCRRVVATGRTHRWRGVEITSWLALGLVYIAEQLGCWANLDDTGAEWEAFQPFPIPPEFVRAIDAEQKKYDELQSGIPHRLRTAE